MNTFVSTTTELSEREQENTTAVYRAIMRVRQRLYATSTTVAKQFDLHSSEMALLDTLGKCGPLTMGQLAERSFSSAANATYTVRGLEKRGLVRRSRSTVSHRVVDVELTREGEKIFRRTYVQTVEAVNGILSGKLTKTERRTVAQLLEKLAAPTDE